MSKKPSLILVALSLGASLLWSVVRPREAEATSCFICDDYFNVEYQMTWHYDVFLFNNDRQGTKHSNWPGDCGQHLPYSLGGGGGGGGGGDRTPE